MPVGRPPRPEWFEPGGTAAREWDRLVDLLERAGTLAETDMGVLALYCEAWHRFAEASQLLDTEGVTLESESVKGQLVRKANPAITVRANAAADLRACADALGITPSSRSKAKQLDRPADGKGRFLRSA